MNSTDSDRSATTEGADALAWAMLAELTGCADVTWALGGLATAGGNPASGTDSTARDGSTQ